MSTGHFLSTAWHRVANLRPKLREHVTIRRHRYRKRSWYILHDHLAGRVHRLSTTSYSIIGAMDGHRTVDHLWNEAAKRLGDDTPSQDDLIQLLAQLYAAGLLQTDAAPNAGELLQRGERASRARLFGNLANPLALRMRLWNPDDFFEQTLPLVRFWFTWSGALAWSLVAIPALLLGAQNWQALTSNVSDQILALDNVVPMIICFLLLKLFHELGHGYAVKAFGGRVYEIGVMFLVFAPMPYVDASAASEFRSKWRRAIVGAAGMLVEVFIASLALFTWLMVEPGLVRATAYNVIIVAGLSTVVFNGNPLLRYDGYYILADIIEIPNLAQRSSRYWAYLVERYLFWTNAVWDHESDRREKLWFVAYAPAAYLYRLFIIISISLFVASEYLALGVVVAIWGIGTSIGLPLWKALAQVFTGPRFQRCRGRAVTVTSSLAIATIALLCLLPAPLYTTTEGVVWLPETANVRARTSGFVKRTLAAPGHAVSVDQDLFESDEITIKTAVDVLRHQVGELETRLAAERFTDRVKVEITSTELAQVRSELATTEVRAERLIARSRAEGTFASASHQDLTGRYVKEGHLLGYVLPSGSKIVRTTVRQDDIDLVRNRLNRVLVKLSERTDTALAAKVIREIPAGSDNLPSKALGGAAGGALPVDPRDPHGTKTLQRVFQFDLELLSEDVPVAFGSRAYVRFEHQWEPVGQQVWRRVRQLVLSRLYT